MRLAITRNASLKTLNTFGVDARAREFTTLVDYAHAAEATAILRDRERWLILGGGSNILFCGDLDALALRIGIPGRQILARDGDAVLVEAGAGENWHEFVCWTLGLGLSGIENLSLIPGTVGASPIQNIGAYGVEISDCLESVDAVNIETGKIERLNVDDCRFGYRDSVFKHADGNRWLILAVRFRLATRFEPRLGYPELARECAAATDAQAVARAVIAIRQRKLPDPAVLGNAGSFFRNPIVEAGLAHALALKHPGLPINETPGGQCKLSAAWMIDQCGWKGFRDGDAGVHDRHALVLVNHGHASGAQVLALANRIRQSVLERFGIELEPEPLIVR